MHPETALEVPLVAQVAPETASSLNSLATTIICLCGVLSALLASLAVLRSSLLPYFWILFHSVQLLAYTVLIEIPRPAPALYLMGKLLKMVRLDLKPTDTISAVDPDDAAAFGRATAAGLHSYSPLL